MGGLARRGRSWTTMWGLRRRLVPSVPVTMRHASSSGAGRFPSDAPDPESAARCRGPHFRALRRRARRTATRPPPRSHPWQRPGGRYGRCGSNRSCRPERNPDNIYRQYISVDSSIPASAISLKKSGENRNPLEVPSLSSEKYRTTRSMAFLGNASIISRKRCISSLGTSTKVSGFFVALTPIDMLSVWLGDPCRSDTLIFSSLGISCRNSDFTTNVSLACISTFSLSGAQLRHHSYYQHTENLYEKYRYLQTNRP